VPKESGISVAVARALTNEAAWRAAPSDVLADALRHVDDAVAQVMGAPDKAARRAMLGKLPPHVRAIVQDRVAALWGGVVVVFATDASEAGHADAAQEAQRRNLTAEAIRLLPRENACWVVTPLA
jgi:hypothetical protein